MDARGVMTIGKSCPRQVAPEPIFSLFATRFPTLCPIENHRFDEAF